MRFWLLTLMSIAAGEVAVAMVVLHFPLRNFLRQCPKIRDEADMAAFKRLASSQMYVSLISGYLLWIPLITWIFGKFLLGQLTWLDGLLFVVLPFAVQVLISSYMIGAARAVRSTPTTSKALDAERDWVVDVWLNKKLPEW